MYCIFELSLQRLLSLQDQDQVSNDTYSSSKEFGKSLGEIKQALVSHEKILAKLASKLDIEIT